MVCLYVELAQLTTDLEEAVRELRETSTRASADWRSLAAHTAAMQEMENEKFDLAKKINEQEAALSMLETEIEELRRESDDVEDWDVEQSVGTDKNAYVAAHTRCAHDSYTLCSLALQLFRGMGFVPHHSASAPDEPFSVLLVRSSKRNAAASFDVDPASMQESKLSPAQLAAQLWAAAG